MLSSLRIWITTGALFLVLLPSLPLDLARLQADGEACSKKGGSCCRLMSALESHYGGGDQLSPKTSACAEDNCSVSSRPNQEGTPAEGSTVRQAVHPKGAPDSGLVTRIRTAGGRLLDVPSLVPSSRALEILVPPPRSLQLA